MFLCNLRYFFLVILAYLSMTIVFPRYLKFATFEKLCEAFLVLKRNPLVLIIRTIIIIEHFLKNKSKAAALTTFSVVTT